MASLCPFVLLEISVRTLRRRHVSHQVWGMRGSWQNFAQMYMCTHLQSTRCDQSCTDCSWNNSPHKKSVFPCVVVIQKYEKWHLLDIMSTQLLFFQPFIVHDYSTFLLQGCGSYPVGAIKITYRKLTLTQGAPCIQKNNVWQSIIKVTSTPDPADVCD